MLLNFNLGAHCPLLSTHFSPFPLDFQFLPTVAGNICTALDDPTHQRGVPSHAFRHIKTKQLTREVYRNNGAAPASERARLPDE